MGDLILIAGSLMAVALLASLVAGRLRVPALLLFLALGMAIGSDALGLLPFDDYELARDVGIVALALIIYEGGLSTSLRDMRPVAGAAVSLAVVGTLVTAAIAGLTAAWLFGLSTLEGLLLGSIVASTDAAAVFALLRGSPLRPRLARVLEGEAGGNDPVAILLVLGFITWIEDPAHGLEEMVALFARQIVIGGCDGTLVGLLAVWALGRTALPTPGLYPVASLAAGALAFGGADALGGSGFLAIYVAGLVLGSAAIPARRTITASTRGSPGWGSWRCSSRWACSCSPPNSATSSRRVFCWPRSWPSSRVPSRASWRRHSARSRRRSGSCWDGRGSVVPCPWCSRRSPSSPAYRTASSSSTSSSSRARLARPPGAHDRAAGPPAGTRHRTRRPGRAARRDRHHPPPGRRNHRVGRRSRPRHLRRTRSRPRTAARGHGQRDRPRRARDSSARLDSPARRGPPPHPRPARHRARGRRPRGALALRPARPAAAPGPDERSWLQTVVGALAADYSPARGSSRRAPDDDDSASPGTPPEPTGRAGVVLEAPGSGRA